MKNLIFFMMFFTLVSCSSNYIQETTIAHQPKCPGTADLPQELEDDFIQVPDKDLLDMALGEPNQGKLCQGKVYQVKKNTEVIVYRAWNSTNPGSKMGTWWAFKKPGGKVSKYRYDYEICYQWSPLDKMVYGIIKPGTKVVVGTGQSAECSQYLSYPASPEKQVFIENASKSVDEQKVYDLVFKWKDS